MRAATVILAALLSPLPAAAVGVTGSIVAHPGFGAPIRPAHEEDRAYYWEVPNGIVPTVPFRLRVGDQVVVTLQGPGLEGEPIGNVDLQIGGPSMVPQTIVAAPGSQLRFINHSGLTVALFGQGIAGFAPEPLHTAHMRVVPVQSPGTFEVRCGHHPSFRGWVVVAASMRVARVAADGTFAFPEVPPGAYELKVMFQGQAVLARSVRVATEEVGLGEIALGAPAPPPPSATPPPSAAPSQPQPAEPDGRERRGRWGRGGGGGGGGGGGAGRSAAAPAGAPPPPPDGPRSAPGELRQHRLSGGP